MKVTVPVGAEPVPDPGATVAVKVTPMLYLEGFIDDVKLVELATVGAGVTSNTTPFPADPPGLVVP
jgi:hypothetical protein